MNDEQIAAALAQERRTATDKIPIEELVTTVRQTAYALHLYLGTGYLEKVYENALKHRLEKKGIFADARTERPRICKLDIRGFVNRPVALPSENHREITEKANATILSQQLLGMTLSAR